MKTVEYKSQNMYPLQSDVGFLTVFLFEQSIIIMKPRTMIRATHPRRATTAAILMRTVRRRIRTNQTKMRVKETLQIRLARQASSPTC